MSLDDLIGRFMDDPDNSDDAKGNIRSLMASHLITGMRLQQQGLLRGAIAEFAKENNRPISSDLDKEIVEKSYVHIARVHKKLGEDAKAKAAFETAHELWKLYGVGSAPHYELAEILIEEGKLDEAIEICQELLVHVPDGGVKQLLAKALEMRKAKSK